MIRERCTNHRSAGISHTQTRTWKSDVVGNSRTKDLVKIPYLMEWLQARFLPQFDSLTGHDRSEVDESEHLHLADPGRRLAGHGTSLMINQA